ncbi:MAG: glycoside hydrolase family 1 [Sphingomonas bacterium]|nr:glycoside hydrolase family 1 [Sphingomonas bacterium]
MTISDGFSRRTALAGGAAIAAGALVHPALASGAARRHFPKGFLWGTAISAHQSEGNDVNSDSWLLEPAGHGLQGSLGRRLRQLSPL